MGCIIPDESIHPAEENIESIMKAPRPENEMHKLNSAEIIPGSGDRTTMVNLSLKFILQCAFQMDKTSLVAYYLVHYDP